MKLRFLLQNLCREIWATQDDCPILSKIDCRRSCDKGMYEVRARKHAVNSTCVRSVVSQGRFAKVAMRSFGEFVLRRVSCELKDGNEGMCLLYNHYVFNVGFWIYENPLGGDIISWKFSCFFLCQVHVQITQTFLSKLNRNQAQKKTHMFLDSWKSARHVHLLESQDAMAWRFALNWSQMMRLLPLPIGIHTTNRLSVEKGFVLHKDFRIKATWVFLLIEAPNC